MPVERHQKGPKRVAQIERRQNPNHVPRLGLPVPVRFARLYVVAGNGCWIWIGQRNPKGYGMFSPAKGDKWRAHRWSYTQKYGPIPEGLVLDHYVCDNPSCVNPDHVRPVTTRENLLRSDKTHAARNAAKTHCKRGHELPPAGSEWRHCRVCNRGRNRRERSAA